MISPIVVIVSLILLYYEIGYAGCVPIVVIVLCSTSPNLNLEIVFKIEVNSLVILVYVLDLFFN